MIPFTYDKAKACVQVNTEINTDFNATTALTYCKNRSRKQTQITQKKTKILSTQIIYYS